MTFVIVIKIIKVKGYKGVEILSKNEKKYLLKPSNLKLIPE
jgi:hypothetical protein